MSDIENIPPTGRNGQEELAPQAVYLGAKPGTSERYEVRLEVNGGWTYAYLWSEGDARQLVTAVNAHRPLVRALRLVASSGPSNNGMRDDNTIAEVRAALEAL